MAIWGCPNQWRYAATTKQVTYSAIGITMGAQGTRTEARNSSSFQHLKTVVLDDGLQTGGALKDCICHYSSDNAEANMVKR